MKQKTLYGIIAIVASIVVISCAPVAYIEKADGVNMTAYNSYTWAKSTENKEQPASKQSTMEERLQKAIGRELQKNGWNQSTGKPDVIISFDVLVERNTKEQSKPVYSQPATRFVYNPHTKKWVPIYFPARYLGEDRYGVDVKEGTLTLTMVDARTEQVIWQGWTTSEVNGRNLSQKEIDKIIKTIFRKADLAKNK